MAIFYVTKDPERATGVEDLLENYHVICPYSSTTTEALKEKGVPVLVTNKAVEGGTYGMLQLPEVQDYITAHKAGTAPALLVLKTSALIARVCRAERWNLWAPKADVAKKYEDKISQYKALHNVVLFPKTHTTTMNNVSENVYPFILQFNAGHSGEGTHIIKNIEQLKHYREIFPNREVRVSQYIEGNTYTLNGLVTKAGDIYTGSISLQLTGLPEATNNRLATVGNDFGAAGNLTLKQADTIKNIAHTVGKVMAEDGYLGLFGIDVIVTPKGIYFVEVNTHQPASISFEATLHRSVGATPLMLIFIRDMMEEGGFSPKKSELPPTIFPHPASQIIYRNKKKEPVKLSDISFPPGNNVLPARMDVVNPGEELFRIQSYSSM